MINDDVYLGDMWGVKIRVSSYFPYIDCEGNTIHYRVVTDKMWGERQIEMSKEFFDNLKKAVEEHCG